MADETVKTFDPQENAWRRGWADYHNWIREYMSSWVLAFILPALVTVIIEIIYLHSSPFTTVVYSLVAGFTGLAFLFLFSLIWHLISGLKQQRDEARAEILNVAAKLQDKTNVLNASVRELVDLEANYNALVETYRPIKELAAIKSGAILKDKKFNVSLIFNQMKTSIISNITFENCTFLGPGVISLLGPNSELTGTSFIGNIDTAFLKADPGRGYSGMCAFLDCKIRNCRFENIGILGDDALKDKLKTKTSP